MLASGTRSISNGLARFIFFDFRKDAGQASEGELAEPAAEPTPAPVATPAAEPTPAPVALPVPSQARRRAPAPDEPVHRCPAAWPRGRIDVPADGQLHEVAG